MASHPLIDRPFELPSTAYRKALIYVSGPMTTGVFTDNIARGCHEGSRLLDLGYAVILPHTNALWEMIHPRSGEEWLRHDLEQIRHVDACLRIPGESFGAEIERDWAKIIGKPWYWSIETLQAGIPCVLRVS